MAQRESEILLTYNERLSNTLKEYKKPARYSSDILIYSGEESVFIESIATLAQPRGWHKMVQIGENILILGGCYQVIADI